MLGDHRVSAARNVTQAERRIVEDRIDLVVFDSSFATVAGVRDGGMLLDIDPELPLALMTDTSDVSVLRAALRAGFADVIDGPLDRSKVAAMVELIDQRAQKVVLKEAKARLGRIVTVFSPKGAPVRR